MVGQTQRKLVDIIVHLVQRVGDDPVSYCELRCGHQPGSQSAYSLLKMSLQKSWRSGSRVGSGILISSSGSLGRSACASPPLSLSNERSAGGGLETRYVENYRA